MNPIETNRLTLRPLTPEDVTWVDEISTQPHILEYMPDWDIPLEQRKRWLDWVISCYDNYKEEIRVLLAIVEKTTNIPMGIVGIGNKEEVNNEVEIAYFIGKDYVRKGYVSEAAKALSQWAMETLKLEYLMAIVEPDNIPSQKVVAQCGFEKIKDIMLINSGETEEKPFHYYRLYPKRKN